MGNIFTDILLPTGIITIIILMIYSKATHKTLKEVIKPIMEMFKGEENE